ncbi:oligoendopeptidase F [Bacillus sp. SM2101]|uniref:oligoendopeptidase F n=1 Tax=Bacillus sp. SM2101 TaxID=2805366 RepID=UPI001BDED2ED|nr:oligoendopeptidase F [Bacillus sp. SM2101]
MTISSNRLPVKDTWDLSEVFHSVSDWKGNYILIEEMLIELKQFEGKIVNGKMLYQYLFKKEEIFSRLEKVYIYAYLLADLDIRDSTAQSLLDQAKQLIMKFDTANTFFKPYLLSLEEKTLKTFLNEETKLNYFKDDLLESYRYRDHVLSKGEEDILSHLSDVLSTPKDTFRMLNYADIKFGEVTNRNGIKIEVSHGNFSKLIMDNCRETRKEAYKVYYKPYLQLKNSFASTLSGVIKNNVMISKVRNFPSSLEKGLYDDKIPIQVFQNLISKTKENLSALHQYTNIRKEILGLNEIRPYDLSVSLTEEVNKEVPYNEAYDLMAEALSPLGDEYIGILKGFKKGGYIDVYERTGKRSGAYTIGLYGFNPYVLLNYKSDLASLFTLTHEMGHAMHIHYSNNSQPRIKAKHSNFVSEVASTVNEVLLSDYLLKNTVDRRVRKYLLNQIIDRFRGTFFIQVMLSEFEKITHELWEQGNALNEEVFNNLYESLFIQYFGDLVEVDDTVKIGWAKFHHLYHPFYVYKYATGFASAIHLAGQIQDNNQELIQSYLGFLKSGCSDSPLNLLMRTGVDLTTQEPFENTLKRFDQLIKEFSTI